MNHVDFPGRQSCRSESVANFLDLVQSQVNKGWGFIPLLGSGISVASGIPTAEKFPAYFVHCLQQALESRFDPHSGDWPPFSVVKQPRPGASEEAAILKKLGTSLETATVDLKQRNHPEAREAEALWRGLQKGRPLKDWRNGLELLSRLFNAKENLGARDERVIDSFFSHLTSQRQPSFGHVMLAHLADALRIRTVLTTNFDTLTEDAFSRLRIPLAAFDVHRNVGLPDSKLVLKQRAIVKLHGGRFGLRADDSLHRPPSKAEKEQFRAYFGSFHADGREEQGHARKHLLGLGMSCSEERTIAFLQSVLTKQKEVHVFWVCYCPKDAKQIQDRLAKAVGRTNRLHLIVHPDIGLLLLQLYQQLYHSLPPGGADYPAFVRVPPNPYSFRDDRPKRSRLWNAGKKGVDDVVATIRRKFAKPADSRLIVLDGEKGVSSICSAAWDVLARECSCVWLELDDFLGPEDLFVALLSEVARSAGVRPPGPFYPEITAAECWKQLSELVRRSDRKFAIFLNGRDGAGHSAGWEAPDVPGVVERQQPSSQWSAGQVARFWSFLSGPCVGGDKAQPSLGDVAIVAMVRNAYPQTDNRPSGRRTRVAKTTDWGAAEERTFKAPSHVPDILRLPVCIEYSAPGIAKAVCDWLDSADGSEEDLRGRTRSVGAESVSTRERFVYGLTLFRHSRHPAVLCSWGLIKAPKQLSSALDNDDHRAHEGAQWLNDLRQMGVLRDKPGGFAWMHRDIRDNLRRMLERREPRLRGLRAECHQGIADWYVKLFRSSNDPLAALESLYHRLCCIEFADRSTEDDECGAPDHIKETAFIEAITTLQLARQRIISCGYFTASTNLVQQIAQAISRMRSHRAAELTRMCRETLRDFAREAADFRMASEINDSLSDTPITPPDHAPSSGPGFAKQDFQALQAMYYKAVILTGMRSYERAENEFHELLRRLGFPEIAPGVWVWIGYRVHDMRQVGRRWARAHKEEAETLRLAVRAIRQYMFLEMLVALTHGYVIELKVWTDPSRPEGPRDDTERPEGPRDDTETVRRKYSEALYILATEIMRYIDDHAFLQAENAQIRTTYGVLMATLGRPWEAHRRLNEASGYLMHSTRRNDSVALAMIDLRRAETYLLLAEREARAGRPKRKAAARDWECLVFAHLEDADFCLQRAQANLDDERRKNAWWWALMCELKLRACACLAKVKPAVCRGEPGAVGADFCRRPPCQKHSRCLAILRETRQLTLTDPFRVARLATLFQRVVSQDGVTEDDRQMRKTLEHDLAESSRKREGRPDDRYPLYDGGMLYVEKVQREIAAKLDSSHPAGPAARP